MPQPVASTFSAVTSSSTLAVSALLSARQGRVFELHGVETNWNFGSEPTVDSLNQCEGQYGVVPAGANALARIVVSHDWIFHSGAAAKTEYEPLNNKIVTTFPPGFLVPQWFVGIALASGAVAVRYVGTVTYTVRDVSRDVWLATNLVWGADVDQVKLSMMPVF